MSLSKAGKYDAGIKHPSPALQVAKKKRSKTLSLQHNVKHKKYTKIPLSCSKNINNITAVLIAMPKDVHCRTQPENRAD